MLKLLLRINSGRLRPRRAPTRSRLVMRERLTSSRTPSFFLSCLPPCSSRTPGTARRVRHTIARLSSRRFSSGSSARAADGCRRWHRGSDAHPLCVRFAAAPDPAAPSQERREGWRSPASRDLLGSAGRPLPISLRARIELPTAGCRWDQVDPTRWPARAVTSQARRGAGLAVDRDDHVADGDPRGGGPAGEPAITVSTIDPVVQNRGAPAPARRAGRDTMPRIAGRVSAPVRRVLAGPAGPGCRGDVPASCSRRGTAPRRGAVAPAAAPRASCRAWRVEVASGRRRDRESADAFCPALGSPAAGPSRRGRWSRRAGRASFSNSVCASVGHRRRCRDRSAASPAGARKAARRPSAFS